MRRSLVLTNEAAGHGTRAYVPSSNPAAVRLAQQRGSVWKLTADDVRGFASAYFATFAAVFVFLI